MTDTTTTDTTETIDTTETTPTESEQPAPLTDEQIAAALGVDTEYLADVKGQLKDLNGFYAKVNKRNMELIEAKRALDSQAPAPAAAPDDDELELDANSQAILDKFVQKKLAEALAPVYQTTQATLIEQTNAVIDDFAATHSDINRERVDEIMGELGLWEASTTPAKLKANLERAAKLAKADETPDYDTEVEKRVAARLKEVTEKGGEVIEVKSKRTSVTEPATEAEVLNDPDIPWHKKLAMLNQS